MYDDDAATSDDTATATAAAFSAYPSQAQEIRGVVAVEINAKSTRSQTNRKAAN